MAIGGYFSLELNKNYNTFYSKENLILNSGRNALLLILKNLKINKLYIPYFSCEAILTPIIQLNLQYEFYSIDENLEPILNLSKINGNCFLLYTNYFGLKNKYIDRISNSNIIIDNAQAFFHKPKFDLFSFNSIRKYFGVPDGAYVFGPYFKPENLNQNRILESSLHLIQRIDESAENGYQAYKKSENILANKTLSKISEFSFQLLHTINYEFVIERRKNNFNFLHEKLKDSNLLSFSEIKECVPLTYPYMSSNENLYKTLIDDKIYCAKYWPNVLTWANENSWEYKLSKETIHLPIDQRYSENDMEYLLNKIL
ncbi:MAG: hypothetical protein ACTIJ9_15415 [Aequorivita sp.]